MVHTRGGKQRLRSRDAGHLHILRTKVDAPVSVRFTSSFGYLDGQADTDGPITLDFPTAILGETTMPTGLSDALRAETNECRSTGDLGDLIVTVADEAIVRGLRPDTHAVAVVIEQHSLRGIIVTAEAADSGGSYDFVSRFFAPIATGMPEDHVTGSAHTALAPFWSPRLGSTRLTGLQASARGGLVRTDLQDDRVKLAGDAVTTLEGTIHLP